MRIQTTYAPTCAHALLCALLLYVASAGPAIAAQERSRLAFDVYLDDSRVGSHSISFERIAEDRMDVEIAIDLEVKFGPFTVFDYRHRNSTEWHNGRLHRMESRTDDNGDRFDVAVDRSAGELLVNATGLDPYTTRPDILPTTYWMASTVAQSQLINTQSGEQIDVEVREIGREDVPGPAGPIPATRYGMSGDLDIDLWYDDDGILVSLAFRARGYDVTYQLAERTDRLPVASALNNLIARASLRR